MTFVDTETSRTLGEPVELFLFQLVDTVYAYTNADDAIVYDGLTYQPVPIKRTSITSSGALDKSTLTVSVAEDTPLAAVLRSYSLTTVMSLQIRQGHASDPNKQFLVAWAGRVVSSKGVQSVREVSCQPVSTQLRRNGLRRNWQLGCPHVLYGDRCRASRPAATVQAMITAVVGNKITFASNWTTRPKLKYAGGYVQSADNEVRTIIAVNGDTLTLSGKSNYAVGAVLNVSLGCDHQTDDCQGLHVPVDEALYGGGNIRNYGGMPYIPQKTPIGFVSNY